VHLIVSIVAELSGLVTRGGCVVGIGEALCVKVAERPPDKVHSKSKSESTIIFKVAALPLRTRFGVAEILIIGSGAQTAPAQAPAPPLQLIGAVTD
jgi:hypothetical protein